MNKVMYCEKCGKVCYMMFSKKCKICNTPLKLLPEEIKYKYHIFVEDWSETTPAEKIQRKENFVMNELSNNPLFSMEDYNKQVNKQIETNDRIEEYNKKQILEAQEKNLQSMVTVTCPYCQSTNTTKISTLSKAGSVAVFGGLSQKVKKQWHCNKCGSDF